MVQAQLIAKTHFYTVPVWLPEIFIWRDTNKKIGMLCKPKLCEMAVAKLRQAEVNTGGTGIVITHYKQHSALLATLYIMFPYLVSPALIHHIGCSKSTWPQRSLART